MAQVTYRANLSARAFPFISDNWGRTVIVPQYDNTYSKALASSEDIDEDIGIPQIYYCHNMLPNAQGFQSVGYTQVITPSTSITDFTSVYLLRDTDDTKVYLGVTENNTFYVSSGTGWAVKGTFGSAGAEVTVAHVSGTSYICVAGYGFLRYDFASQLFVSVTLSGLNTALIKGLTGAVGYLIAWSSPVAAVSRVFTTTSGSTTIAGAATTGIVLNQPVKGTGIPDGTYVAAITGGVSITLSQAATVTGSATLIFSAMSCPVGWSSTIDPTDFVPSLVTGAGGGNVEGARGAITFCAAHTLGFIVYTTNNAVSAVYSNNARYPFNFREIVASGGVASQGLVSVDANSSNHYAYTTSGFQLVSTSQAQTVLADLTDFISGRVFEDFDETTNTFTQTQLTAPMQKKLNVIADRYLIISYGIDSLTHAIIYDISQKRFGKVKIPHVATIEYQLPDPDVVEIPKQSVGFLQADGALKVIDFSPYSTNSYGVIALGKYQFVRQRLLQLDTISVENIYNQSTFECLLLTSLDGKNTAQSTPDVLSTSGKLKVFGTRKTGINHSLVFKGSMQLNSVILQFNLDAKR